MRVHLKGIHRVNVRLANGATAEYFYAWRKGPRLVGEPGSAEFIASYTAAHQSRRAPDRAIFHSIIAGYKASTAFLNLSPCSKSDYLKQIKKIEAKFGDLPLAALDDLRVTNDFLQWRDSMGNRSATSGLRVDGADVPNLVGARPWAMTAPSVWPS
jgi:hypothetical protein